MLHNVTKITTSAVDMKVLLRVRQKCNIADRIVVEHQITYVPCSRALPTESNAIASIGVCACAREGVKSRGTTNHRP